MAETAKVGQELLTGRRGSVLLLVLNRPSVHNALSDALVAAVVKALEDADKDPAVRAAVLTGGEKVFAAGADIGELVTATRESLEGADRLAQWAKIRKFSKPLIAAVGGFALGGGCELALSCDLILAGDNASFGQPEINIGVMPGAGGTQRLTRVLGRYRALELCLGLRRMPAKEALDAGLVCRVVPAALLIEEAMAMASQVAALAPLAVRSIKEAVHFAEDLDLDAALTKERQMFYKLFDTADQKEGMRAFLQKRKPVFQGK